MFIQPIYNILLLPDVTYFFKKDFFADRADELETGSDILFLFLKNEIADGIPASDAFYPVGLSAKVETSARKTYCRYAPLTAWRSTIRLLKTEKSMSLLYCVLLSKIWEKTNSRQNSQTAHSPAPVCPGLPVGTVGAGVYPAAQKYE